ncbi:MAG: T9SS type A sorting domain-containing protein [Saprospiraceae bacterium]
MKNATFCLTIAFLLLVLVPTTYGQKASGYCGTEHLELVKEALIRTRNENAGHLATRNVIKYIPIKFHLVANAAGVGRVTEDKVFEMLCELNAIYKDFNMQFYVKEGFNYFNHDATYDNPKSGGAGVKMEGQRDFKAINIYIVNTISADQGTTLGYFDPQSDWLVILKNQVSKKNTSTLAHELGHFFSLLHTFDGWECQPYDAAIHGIQVGKYAPCSSLAPPYPAVENELQDGSNCANAGDLICDTPPDYNFGFGWPQGDCDFTDVVKDYKGITVHPMETNMMGYFISCTEYQFTPMQEDQVFANYTTATNRNYIRTTHVPPSLTVTGEAHLLSPSNESTVETFDSVMLTWDAPIGADRFVVIMNRMVGNTVLQPSVTYFTNTNQLLLTNLNKSYTFQWRVLSYNEYATCSTGSANFKFSTGTTSSVPDFGNPTLSGITIGPNPIGIGQLLNVRFSTNKTFNAEFRFVGMNGQVIGQIQSASILPTINSVSLSLSDMQTGLYYVQIITDEGIQSLPLYITE